MNVKEFCEKLNIEYAEPLDEYFERGKRLYKERGDFAFDKERLTGLNKKYNIFRKWFSEVLLAADEVAADEALSIFVYTLAEIYKDKKTPNYYNGVKSIRILNIPDRNRRDTDIAPLFAALYFLEDMISELEGRGLPHEVISDTLAGMDSEMDDYYAIYGRCGMRTFAGWYRLFVACELLTIGRLQFQIYKFSSNVKLYKKGNDLRVLADGLTVHKRGMILGSLGQQNEDEGYIAEISEDGEAVVGYMANGLGEIDPEPVRLCGYSEVLCRGDDVLSVHIRAGEPLAEEICEESYRKANEIFSKCYPEIKFKAFFCASWMMNKRLKLLLGRETNVTRFADKYVTYPLKSSGQGVFGFVFNVESSSTISELPENNSIQRAIKKYIIEGNHFYEYGGIRLIEED